MKIPCEQELLNALKEFWNLKEKLNFVRLSENFVYKTLSGDLFIRLSIPGHRKLDELYAEMDWINELSRQELSVSKPLASQNNENVEEVTVQGITYYCSIFQAAQGKVLEKEDDYTSEFIQNWGSFIGKMHNTTTKQAIDLYTRNHWDKDDAYLLARKAAGKTQTRVATLFENLESELKRFSKDPDHYGLIHGDLHYGNFLVNNDQQLTAFDFDDCQYHWLAYDWAVVIASMETFTQTQKIKWEPEKFYENFFKGYTKERPVNEKWMQKLPMLVAWRHALVYFWIKSRILSKRIKGEDKNKVIDFQGFCHQRLLEISKTL